MGNLATNVKPKAENRDDAFIVIYLMNKVGGLVLGSVVIGHLVVH